MSVNYALPFELQDIIVAFDKFGEVISSADTIDNLSNSPAHKLLFNEILKFSKEELESPIKIRNRNAFIYDYVFSQRHCLFFKACILKGAFIDKLSEETKWLLDNVPNPSDQLFEAIHYMERNRIGREFDDSKPITFNKFMDLFMSRYFYIFDSEEKKYVMELILDKYAHQEVKFFEKLVVTDMPIYSNHSETHEYIGKRLHELGLATKNLNGYLTKLEEDDTPDYVRHFNFGEYGLSKIDRLLKCGFRFNEQDYSYNGDNLFIALTKSKQLKACELIFPYLSDINPKSGSFAEQHAFIASLPKIYPKDYKFFQSHYEKMVLNLELDDKKEDNTKVKKPKI